MFAFNLTGELDQMRRRHDLVAGLGGTCVMASLNSVGLVGMVELARARAAADPRATATAGATCRATRCSGSPMSPGTRSGGWPAPTTCTSTGFANKFSESDESVIASARACLTPLFDSTPGTVMPVFSSGQTVRQAAATYAALGSVDLIHAAGGGIMAHPARPGRRRGGAAGSVGGGTGGRSARGPMRADHPALASGAWGLCGMRPLS